MLPLLQRLECWSGNRVTSELGEQVELDTGVGSLVEAGCGYTARELDGAGTLDLEVDALWVRLCAVGLSAGVQGDDFMADDVVSWGEVGDGEVLDWLR